VPLALRGRRESAPAYRDECFLSREAQARNFGPGAERRAARGAMRSYSEDPEEL
jgi:hypothetical protein